MKQGFSKSRGRSRNNNYRKNNSKSKNNNSYSRRDSFDTNGPAGKFRGSSAQLSEKYSNAARDAIGHGDIILAESCFQHADHYNRISASFIEAKERSLQKQKEEEEKAAAKENSEPAIVKEEKQDKKVSDNEETKELKDSADSHATKTDKSKDTDNEADKLKDEEKPKKRKYTRKKKTTSSDDAEQNPKSVKPKIKKTAKEEIKVISDTKKKEEPIVLDVSAI